MQIQNLRFDQLRIDGGTQLRVLIDQDHVAEIRAAWIKPDDVPPFVAFFDGVTYWLADGFHRWHAANGKWIRVSVEVHQGSQRDAILYACGANRGHGLKRTNADKRKAVETLLKDEEWSNKSDRWVAASAGVSEHLVGEIRTQLRECADETTSQEREEEQEKRDGRDGRKRPAKRSSKKKEEKADSSNGKQHDENTQMPDRLKPIFALADEFKAFDKVYCPRTQNLADDAVLAMFDQVQNPPLNAKQVRNLMGQIYNLLMPWNPDRVCDCGGENKGCKKCKGRGWLPKAGVQR